MHRLLPLVLLLGCPKPVPDHLRVEPPPQGREGVQPSALTDATSAVERIVGSDPLVRSPSLPSAEVLRDIDDADHLVDYVEVVKDLERGDGQVPRGMQQIEDEHRGTEGVALARGYRLRVVENLIASPAQSGAERDKQILSLLSPLTPSADGAKMNRPPLDWLDGDTPLETRIRDYGERWTLLGWLDGPKVRVAPAGDALAADMYDGLVRTPVGALVASRAERSPADPAAVQSGIDDLRRATVWALEEVAADRDREQASWAKTKAEAVEELGDDPIGALLRRAQEKLSDAGGDERAVGGALLAHSARRWRDSCDDAPCIGLDRVDAMTASGRWHAEVEPLAQIWRVVALKDALDTMDVAHDTVLYPKAAVALTDAVLGTGGGPLEDQVLRKRSPDAGVWLVLSRAVGVEGVTSWDGALAALGAHLQRESQTAAAAADDDAIRSLLDRIAQRAVP